MIETHRLAEPSTWTPTSSPTRDQSAHVSIGGVAERALLVHEGTAALIGSTIDEHALKRMAAARQRGLLSG